jgi:hypothetical protein
MGTVKRTRGGVALALIAVVMGLTLGTCAAQAQDQPAPPDKQEKTELKELVKWAVWHEGCRIYAADNSIGDIEDIRQCVIAVYGQDPDAQQQLRDASPDALLGAVRTAAREIPGERQLGQYFEYACKHEQLLDKFKEFKQDNDYESIRTLYYDTFKNNEKARNLLAALSDEALGDLIGEMR